MEKKASLGSAALVALALALAVLACCAAAAFPSAAFAEEPNVALDVPTTVPCAVKADGTVITPDNWEIRNDGNRAAFVSASDVSASDANSDFYIYAAIDKEMWLVVHGDYLSVTRNLTVPAGGNVPLSWSATGIVPWAFASLADGPVKVATIKFSYSLVPQVKTFAVYSADDNSLDFYKRASVPSVGDIFEGKTATAVYTDIETNTHYQPVPWKNQVSNIVLAAVVDSVAPVSTSNWFDGCRNMTSCDLSKLDTSKVTDMDSMFQYCSSLTSLDVSNFDTANVKYLGNMFRGCSKLSSLDVSSFDTSNATAMHGVFQNCSSLTTISGISDLNTSNATNMSFMFYNCSKLSSLDLSKLDTPNVTGMTEMFQNCSSLTSLDLSSFDTSKVTNMYMMFSGCSKLTKLIGLSIWDTSSVTNMSSMFRGCFSLTTLDVSHFDTSSVTNMSGMFSNCSNLATIDVSSWSTPNVTDMGWIFSLCKSLASVGDLSSWDTSKVTDMSFMFQSCSSLTSLDVSTWNTSSATNMNRMFYECSSLTSLDVSDFSTSKVTNMREMFVNCSGLATLDVSHFDTSKVTDMFSMFYNCSKLTTLDVSTWNTSQVTNMGGNVANGMFSGCSSLKTLDVSHFDTSKVTNMDGMFQNCSSLTSLDVSNFDTSNTKGMYGMFYGCNNLVALDVSHFSTSNVTDMYGMFLDCSSLTSLDLSGWDTSHTTKMSSMFLGCSKLQEIILGEKFAWIGTSDRLPAPNSTYITGADGKWYAKSDGTAYAPADIPSNKADTYYAVKPLPTASAPTVEVSGRTETGSALTVSVSGLPDGDNSVSYQWQTSPDGTTWTDSGQSDATSATFVPGDSCIGLYVRCVVSVKNSVYSVPDGVSATFGPIEAKKTAFAVYSADDNSLDFYKRANVPSEGATFEGKTATAVYTGIENTDPMKQQSVSDDVESGIAVYAGEATIETSPFTSCASNAKSISVKDSGIQPTRVDYWFHRFTSMTSCDLSKLDTSKTTRMDHLFQYCYKLESVDGLSGWDTSSATTLGAMFDGCESLVSIGDLSNWDTSNVTGMSSMFADCSSLTALTGLSSWDTSNVTGMDYIFYGCSSLTSLSISNFDTSSVTSMGNMFNYCSKLQEIALGAKWKWVGTNGYLPTPSSTYITGADGKWYAKSDGTGYAPEDIPGGKADTYYASKDLLPGPLTGTVTVWGDPVVGSTLAASASGMQAAAAPSYEWYAGRPGEVTEHVAFPATEEVTMTINVTSAPSTLSFANVKGLTSTQSAQDGIALYAADTGSTRVSVTAPDGTSVGAGVLSYSFDYANCEFSLTQAGRYTILLDCAMDHYPGLSCQFDMVYQGTVSSLVGTGETYTPTSDDVGKTMTCRVSDASGRYTGYIEGSASGAVSEPEAFAVYSADDKSLRFYKRAGMPSPGDTFDGRTATKVYTGVEGTVSTKQQSASAYAESEIAVYAPEPAQSTSPFSSSSSGVQSVSVEDDGIQPKSMEYWFCGFSEMASCDLSKIDASKATSMDHTFFHCYKLTSLDLSSWDTSSVTDMDDMFQYCSSLTSLDVSSFDTSKVTNTNGMFDGCFKLQEITLGAKWKWVGTNGYLPTPSNTDIPGADGKWYAESDGAGYAPADIPSNKADTYYASKSLRDAAAGTSDEESVDDAMASPSGDAEQPANDQALEGEDSSNSSADSSETDDSASTEQDGDEVSGEDEGGSPFDDVADTDNENESGNEADDGAAVDGKLEETGI